MVGVWVLGLGCGESAPPDAAPPAAAAAAAAEPSAPKGPPPLARPTDPAAFAEHHVLVPDGATLYLGPQPGAATVTLRLPPAAGERAPTPAQTMRVVGHEGGRLKLQTAAPELGCTPPPSGLTGLEVAVWVEPAALARVVGRELEATFEDGTSVKLRPGVVVGPPAARVEVSADGLRLAVPIDEGDISTRFVAEPMLGVPTGLSALEPGAPLAYAGGDPVLPESSLVGGGLIFARRTQDDRTFVRVASRCAEVEAVVDSARLVKPEPTAAPDAAAPDPIERPAGRYAIRGPSGDPMLAARLAPGPTWTVDAGKAITWPDGTPAGTTTAAHEFTVEPTTRGDRACFAVPTSEAALDEGEQLPLCLLATDVTRVEDVAHLAASAGLLGMLAAGGGELSSPYGSAFGGSFDDMDMGGLMGTEIGEAFGAGGMDLRGIGEGGGGTGEGTIGLGSLGTGRGGGGGSGYGVGGLGTAGPSGQAKMGKVAASGLDSAAAVKVVTRSRNQLRYCYEKQLALDSKLAGKLALALEVEAGKVATATATSATLPDDLLRCVERSAKRWRFSGDGSLTVPVTFTAG